MGWPSISTNWAEAHWDSWPGPSFFSQISSSSSFSIALKFLLRVSSLKGTLMTCANLTKFWALTLALPNAISLSFPKHLLLTFKLVFNTPFLAFSVFGFGIANVGSFLEVFFLSFRVFRACSKKIRKKSNINILFSEQLHSSSYLARSLFLDNRHDDCGWVAKVSCASTLKKIEPRSCDLLKNGMDWVADI